VEHVFTFIIFKVLVLGLSPTFTEAKKKSTHSYSSCGREKQALRLQCMYSIVHSHGSRKVLTANGLEHRRKISFYLS